jgi:hypothetical protein
MLVGGYPPRTIDGKQVVEILFFFVGNQANFYGPVFNRLVFRYASGFESKKLGENLPEDVYSFEQVREYLIRNLDRYPHGYCALLYGLIKAEVSLQGVTGVSTRIAAIKTAEKLRLASEGEVESAGTITDAIKKCHEGIRAGKILPDFDYELVGGEQIRCTIHNCHFRDACRASIEENLGRAGGSPWCALLRYAVADMSLISGLQFEYELEEFGSPNCKGRIYEI